MMTLYIAKVMTNENQFLIDSLIERLVMLVM